MQKFEDREFVEFSNNGEKIFGVIHRPLGEDHCPLVIFCHGLAGDRIGKNRLYVQLSECLSHIGIASFRFDFRGSGDSEGEFSEMSIEGEVSDVMCAYDFLLEQKKIDFNRIGVYGRSFGAAIAVMAAHRFGNTKSMALWAPIYNAEQWEEQWEKLATNQLDEKQRHELMRINGQLPSLHFYKELFEMRIDQELSGLQKIPMLLIHGEHDPIVGIQHSEKYYQTRQYSEGKTDFVRLEHSDHDFTHPEEKIHAINLTCQWFAKTL